MPALKKFFIMYPSAIKRILVWTIIYIITTDINSFLSSLLLGFPHVPCFKDVLKDKRGTLKNKLLPCPSRPPLFPQPHGNRLFSSIIAHFSGKQIAVLFFSLLPYFLLLHSLPWYKAVRTRRKSRVNRDLNKIKPKWGNEKTEAIVWAKVTQLDSGRAAQGPGFPNSSANWSWLISPFDSC